MLTLLAFADETDDAVDGRLELLLRLFSVPLAGLEERLEKLSFLNNVPSARGGVAAAAVAGAGAVVVVNTAAATSAAFSELFRRVGEESDFVQERGDGRAVLL